MGYIIQNPEQSKPDLLNQETKKEQDTSLQQENSSATQNNLTQTATTPKDTSSKTYNTPVKQEVLATSGGSEKAIPSPSPCDPGSPTDFSSFVGKDLNDIPIYQQLISKAGSICTEGVVYTVQIGAYRHPENFKYPRLSGFAKAEIKPYPDGISRFTMKEFKTLKEAEEFRQKVIAKGTKDAWITAFVRGDRKLLQDIIAVNFYTGSVN